MIAWYDEGRWSSHSLLNLKFPENVTKQSSVCRQTAQKSSLQEKAFGKRQMPLLLKQIQSLLSFCLLVIIFQSSLSLQAGSESQVALKTIPLKMAVQKPRNFLQKIAESAGQVLKTARSGHR